ncbi:MAG: tyrosine-type recombinase/integrase [Deltaproteobacteria bacterium]|nr:tyrosine-type recombinase/integrase [Deltaproteobacteria bacterium]MBW2202027.1 tyrosine-type recombinase/integrase [Deltaproteobacteria bacterium]
MAVTSDNFFRHINDFFNYRQDIYEISPQTVKSNRVDLDLFKNFICSQNQQTIDGPAVIDFQYYLKNQRQNCGASINRKLFTLRSYGNFFKLYDLPCADALPFYDVLKIRSGYRNRPGALTPQQIELLFKTIETDPPATARHERAGTILGIRDYAVYAMMYQLGLRVGEVHGLNLADLDFKNCKINVIGKGRKPRTLHVNDELIETLCQYLAVRERFLNSHLSPALFISKKGNRLAIRTMEDNLKKILLYVPFEVSFNVSCHTLRHSMASHLNDKNVDILVIQSILGHSSTRSTESYIHPSQDRIRKAMDKLPGIKFVKELIRKGELNLRFQKPFRPKRE